ncbi:MAG TPA: type II toxin-antitoxin system VapC family toxin [Bryobacterales bacterium]|nr:type II toxin-antitoxin system VapC family toxin [Bryobacterales bacterium]
MSSLVLDSSAMLAILLREPGHEDLLQRIDEASLVAVGAPTLVETGIVLSSRLGRDARSLLMDFVRDGEIEVVPFTGDHVAVAIRAFLRFGKGRHRAALNFGDCLSYAVAGVAGMELVYVGDDFGETDLGSGG